MIYTLYSRDYSHETVKYLNVQVICGDLTVKSEVDCLSWRHEKVKRAVDG